MSRWLALLCGRVWRGFHVLRYADPDLGPTLELASHHPNETEHASSEQKPLKRAGFGVVAVTLTIR